MQGLWNIWPVLLISAIPQGALAEMIPPEIRHATAAGSPAARIGDVDFLVGHWIGTGLGGCAEEIMAPPADGQIMGMFRQMTAEGALRFYEFYTIAEAEGSLILRIKHFDPDMTGWEEKNESAEFPLVAIEGTTAYFDGLTFSRTGKNGFASAVDIDGQGVAAFDMRKAKEADSCGGR